MNALITGATSLVGQAICRRLASNKMNIIIHYYRKEDIALKLKKELEKKYKIKCLCIKADLRNEEEINDLIKQSIEFKTDILVNNAALDLPNIFDNKTKDEFKEILDVNLIAPFLLAQKLGSEMFKNEYGKIINIASTNGIDTCFPMCLDYDASKAGLISLTHNLAIEFKPYVNVNAIAPGWIKTDEVKDLDEEYIKEEEEKIFKNRFGEVDEIAYLVEFLVSDKAEYINNQVIRIDGGMY